MIGDIDLESCGYGVCKAVKMARSVCGELKPRDLVPSVVKGIIGATFDNDILPKSKLDNFGEGLIKHIKGKPIVEATIGFVKMRFKDIETKDAVIKGTEIALKITKEAIKDSDKEKEYESKFKAAYQELEKAKAQDLP